MPDPERPLTHQELVFQTAAMCLDIFADPMIDSHEKGFLARNLVLANKLDALEVAEAMKIEIKIRDAKRKSNEPPAAPSE